MNDRYLADMTTADLDGDGTPEIAVCTYAADTGTSGVRLFVSSNVVLARHYGNRSRWARASMSATASSP